MSYDFEFDLECISRSFFRKISEIFNKDDIESYENESVEEIIRRFDLRERVEAPVEEVGELVKDIICIRSENLEQEKDFRKSKNRALLLPHCSRKHMDRNCDASFDSRCSTYECKGCSDDCLINKAKRLGDEENYDTFVLPGGSCIPKIIEKNQYDGIVAVACPDEVHMCTEILKEKGILHQGVPLLKNGCSNTVFNLEDLKKALRKG